MAVISRTIIDPFGTQHDHSTASSKSIFKEQNLRSGIIQSKDLNELTSIFKNNSIIKGLTINSIYLSNNDRTINIQLNSGKLIQDYVLFNITETVNLSVDVFTELDIHSINTTENYFEVSGDYTDNFPINKTFGIFNSNTAQYNHIYWTVLSSVYVSGTNTTKIYTTQSLTVDDSSGIIVNDNFVNSNTSTTGTILITSQFKFIETLDDNPIIFIPVYMDSTYNYYPNFDTELNKIIYALISITKNMSTFTIEPTIYKIEDEVVNITIQNVSYDIHNMTNLVTDTLEGGNISV